jgi:hypothetical protein
MKTPNAKSFFAGLYRDLDDRHLVLPALLLVVAIIAVPVVLGGSSAEPAAPPPAPVVADAHATAVESAVLATDPGVRDYTQRLEALKEKNPFVQQFADKSSENPLDASTAALGADTTGTEAAGAAVTAPSGSTSVPGSGGDVPTETTPAPDTTTPTDPTTGDTPQVQTQTRFFAPRIDVTFGKLGEAKEITDVRHFDFLPNEKTPVVAFLGLGESADKAVFGVSNEVVETSGDGSCAPHEVDGCDLLVLRVGEQRILKLVDGTTYRLKVTDTHFTRIPDPRG